MQVKNISSSTISIPDLGIKDLQPGGIFDLSNEDPSKIRTHQTLNLYFEKGLLANLGRGSKTPGTRASLLATKARIDKLNLMGNTENVIKQKKKTPFDRRALIDDLASKKVQDKFPRKGYDPAKERYREEFYYNRNPAEYDPDKYEEDYEPRSRPQFEEDFNPIKIDYEGHYQYFGEKGNIETSLITGETTNLNLIPEKKEENNLTVTGRSGEEYQVSFDEVKERILRKCIGITSTGKPCKKYAVRGFQSCLTHMSQTEKQEYHQLKDPKK